MEFTLIKKKGTCTYFEGTYNGKKYEVIYKTGRVGERRYYIFDDLGNPLDEESELYYDVDKKFRDDFFDWYKVSKQEIEY